MRSILFIALLAVTSTAALAGDGLIGRASVIDGDTIELHGQRIRIHGIDAPEARQRCSHPDGSEWRCGREAAFALDDLLQARVLDCDPRDQDRYGRIIAVCRIGSIDIGEWMVRNGWATAYRRYSTDYGTAEEKARAEGRGIWSGSFENPEVWRWGG